MFDVKRVGGNWENIVGVSLRGHPASTIRKPGCPRSDTPTMLKNTNGPDHAFVVAIQRSSPSRCSPFRAYFARLISRLRLSAIRLKAHPAYAL